MAIQTSRISTHLHLWGTPRGPALWMKKCWPNPCSTFCSSGGPRLQEPCGRFFKDGITGVCVTRPNPQHREAPRPGSIQALGWPSALSDLPPMRRRALATPQDQRSTGWGRLGVTLTSLPLTPPQGSGYSNVAFGGSVTCSS